MASVNWEKIKEISDMKKIARHCDKDCRLQDNHENEHIDKLVTIYNAQTYDYETICKRIDDRMEYLDSLPNQNKRKDRVIGFALEIPIPDGIPDSKSVDFLNKVNKIISNQIGSKNMLGSYLHFDEVHDYIDSSTKQKRTSMRHAHTLVTAAIDGKLNAREMSNKKNLVKLNNAIEKMCREDYGVAFLTGEKSKSKESVESLKLKSKALELEQRENVVEQREESVAQQEIDVEARERAVAKRESETDIVYKAAYKKLSEADKKLSEVTQREQAVAKREKSVQQAENSMTVKLAALQNRADELEAKELEYEEKMQKERKKMLKDIEQREAILKQRENELADKQKNFNAEVRKQAKSIVEREKEAAARVESDKNAQKQAEMLSESFSSSVFGSND